MADPRPGRRTLLAALGGMWLAGCARGPEKTVEERVGASPVELLTYGDDPSQWVDLHAPEGGSRGLVVVIHGGFWRAQYDASLGTPLAEALVSRGWTAANVEYRRVGNGGGFPETLDDIHAAIGVVATDAVGPVVTLGHSAGGHLATWAAARGRFERWSDGPALTHVVSQAGVLDLRATVEQHLGNDAALAFLGEPDETTYEQADPMTQVPLDVPMWAVHARDDDTVPFAQSSAYVAAATSAGADATLVEVTGGHFGVVDPASPAWASIIEVLDGIA